MLRLRSWLVLAVGVLVPLAAAGVARADLKIGVVDILQVTNDYDRTKDANEDLKADQEALRAASEPKVNNLKEMQVRRDGFKRGSDEWKKADDELLKADIDVRTWLALEQAKIERRHRDILLDMYHQIDTVVTRLAKQKGLDIVFTKAFLSPPQINLDEAQGLEDLKNRIMNQRVLYPNTAVDLTQEVLQVLNADYQAAKKAAGGTKAPKTPAGAPKG